MGPLVITQDFGARYDQGNSYLLGVVYNDSNRNNVYNAGEGLGGVSVSIVGSAGSFNTTTMTAGGYQLQVPSGSYTVTFSGGSVQPYREVSDGRLHLTSRSMVSLAKRAILLHHRIMPQFWMPAMLPPWAPWPRELPIRLVSRLPVSLVIPLLMLMQMLRRVSQSTVSSTRMANGNTH